MLACPPIDSQEFYAVLSAQRSNPTEGAVPCAQVGWFLRQGPMPRAGDQLRSVSDEGDSLSLA